jgi:hypothetical protein
MNRKGQFSIIAALFVVVILVSSVMVTYSAIRYSSTQSQPQIISAVDETNLALKQVLGFTVGYFGSVLQVTGNSSYAYAQSSTYLNSGLTNIVDMNPEWGTSFSSTNLSLNTNWFTNDSYSEGTLNVTYNLIGLGITGIAYSVSCSLNVQILPSASNNQVCLTVIQNENEPVVDLSMANFNFYRYQYSNLTWAMVNPPNEPVSSSNGTYTIDIPSGINPQSYIIQVEDSRGIMVAASSFSHYTGSLTFNSTTVSGGNYVNQYDSKVDSKPDIGTHSNFAAQQQAPDGAFDTLTEAQVSSPTQNYYPNGYTLGGSTTLSSGSLTDLTKNNSPYMIFESYASATKYGTITYDSSSSVFTHGASSISWTQTTGTGNNRILLVSVNIFSYSGAPSTVKTVTYGSTSVTANYNVLYSASNPEVHSYVYYLVNPSSGANTIKVTFSPAPTAAVCGSITYFNVNQISPIQAENTATNSGKSQSSGSVSASGTYSQVLYGNIAATAQSSSSYTVNDVASPQTNRWSNFGSYTHSGTNYYCVGKGSDETVTASGQVSLSWTTTLSVNWAGIAILLAPTQVPTQETCQVTFSGSSNTLNWNNLIWAIDGSSSIANTGVTLQLFNYNSGQYPTSGSGYMSVTLGTSNQTEQQTISTNEGNFRDDIGNWKLCLTATASVSSAFTISLDLARYSPSSAVYGLSLEEQWTNLNSTALPNPSLCIYEGTMGSNNLAVDAWYDGSWQLLSSSLVNGWNNMSINSYLAAGSTSFTIRFINNDAGDTAQISWQVAAAILRPESDQALFTSLQSPAATVAVELLQNGTMIWLGQNLITTQTIPIPPVPVKALHINETIEGVNQQVPFQIEDWASSYTIPLGLTNNATVFSNMQMIVFLVNTHVSAFTLWWNGSAEAIQTPLAYSSSYFKNDNLGTKLDNGQLNLQFSNGFTITSTVDGTNTASTTNFLQINTYDPTYGSGIDWVIVHGVVRDIIQQEAEWQPSGQGLLGGVPGCPNFYADIVLTLPANATYFTYQISLLFLNSTQTRTINELDAIWLNSTVGTLQTENGIANGDPIVSNGTQTFSSTGTWVHHWSQFIAGTGSNTQGAGIMFTDQANHMLYTFDSPGTARGALEANTAESSISLLPVTLSSDSFQNPLDVTWDGAVVTFAGFAPPIYSENDQPGLWILAEMPPTITVTVGN